MMLPATDAVEPNLNDTATHHDDPRNDTRVPDHSVVAIDTEDQSYSSYDSYVELVLAHGIGFCPIAPDLFVVQGWDMRLRVGTVS